MCRRAPETPEEEKAFLKYLEEQKKAEREINRMRRKLRKDIENGTITSPLALFLI